MSQETGDRQEGRGLLKPILKKTSKPHWSKDKVPNNDKKSRKLAVIFNNPGNYKKRILTKKEVTIELKINKDYSDKILELLLRYTENNNFLRTVKVDSDSMRWENKLIYQFIRDGNKIHLEVGGLKKNYDWRYTIMNRSNNEICPLFNYIGEGECYLLIYEWDKKGYDRTDFRYYNIKGTEWDFLEQLFQRIHFIRTTNIMQKINQSLKNRKETINVYYYFMEDFRVNVLDLEKYFNLLISIINQKYPMIQFIRRKFDHKLLPIKNLKVVYVSGFEYSCKEKNVINVQFLKELVGKEVPGGIPDNVATLLAFSGPIKRTIKEKEIDKKNIVRFSGLQDNRYGVGQNQIYSELIKHNKKNMDKLLYLLHN